MGESADHLLTQNASLTGQKKEGPDTESQLAGELNKPDGSA